jgi:hypothetical protein
MCAGKSRYLHTLHTPVSRGRRSTDRGQRSVIQGYVSANANAGWLIVSGSLFVAIHTAAICVHTLYHSST